MSTPKKLTSSEISTHTSKNDCWLIIHGKVYDVSDFLDDHPGGDDVLLQAAANGDATQSFEEVGHSSTATSMMEGFLIGSVDGDGAQNTNQVQARDPPLAGKAPARKTAPPTPSTSFMDILLPLLILALAFAAWYYLTYINVEA